MDKITDLLTKFGFAWPKFLAQVLIFMIVYWVLNKYAFGPVVAMLQQRKARIAEAEADRERIKQQLAESEAQAQKALNDANEKADKIVAEARESAEALSAREQQKAQAEAAQVIEKAKEAGALERDRMAADLKREFGRLVVSTTEKVTGKVLSPEDQNNINQETASQIAQ